MPLLVTDIDLVLTMDPTAGDGPLGELRDAAILLDGDRIGWIGPRSRAPDVADRVSGRGCVALPGLVDCHTHAVWAGSRADEWQRRLAGESYTAILEAGGGILSTVRATRAASEDTLAHDAAERLAALRAHGVTTIEVKSGYGLTPADERKLLVAARRAGELAGVDVFRTFLGAHTIPAEWRHDRAAYVDQVIHDQLPVCAPEADAIDVYVDRGAFTLDEGERILAAGRAHGLAVRVHAEQVTFTGAARMAAGLGARSADHLERIDDAGIAAMAEAGTVGVLLPGAMLYLKDPAPPVARLREAGVPLAVATDLNPGTSPVLNPWICATLACVTMGLTVNEALLGFTRNAARVLGADDRGVLAPGLRADLVLMKPPPSEPVSAAALVHSMGGARPVGIWGGGRASRS